MAHFVAEGLQRARQAVEFVAGNAAQVDVLWLAAGTVLFLAAQAIRQRGWYHILLASYPDATGLRARDVVAAYFAGAGLNGVLPARAGDVVKLAWLHRRIDGSSYVTLAATLVPETAFETLCGVALVVWALARGFIPVPSTPGELPTADVTLYLEHPVLAALATAGVFAAAVAAFQWARRRSADLWHRLRRGLAIFASPGAFLARVASWQALGRGVRLASLACFLAAFALPVTASTALLVMAAQGGGRIVPIAPVSAGLRVAMLSYGLVEVTGEPVDPARVTAFTFGVGAVVFMVMLVISLVLLRRELHTGSPREALRRAKARMRPPPSKAPGR
jgi:hypothetical protein